MIAKARKEDKKRNIGDEPAGSRKQKVVVKAEKDYVGIALAEEQVKTASAKLQEQRQKLEQQLAQVEVCIHRCACFVF